MHTTINFPQSFIVPARTRRPGLTQRKSTQRATHLTLDAQAARHMAEKRAFVLENYDTSDPEGNPLPPSQIFFFTATPIRNEDGSTTFRVDQ